PRQLASPGAAIRGAAYSLSRLWTHGSWHRAHSLDSRLPALGSSRILFRRRMQAPNISLCSDRCKTDYAGVEQPGGTLRFSAVFSRCRGDAANLVLLLGFFGTRARRAGSPHDISITR